MKRVQLLEIEIPIHSVSIRIDRNLYIDEDGFETVLNTFLRSEGFLSSIHIEVNRDISVHLNGDDETYKCEDGVHYIFKKCKYEYKLVPEN